MKQVQLFLEDASIDQITTSILAVGHDRNGAWVALKENLFHPQGGGQPADIGCINELEVVAARVQDLPDAVVLQLVPNSQDAEVTSSFRPGDTVSASVNMLARRTHSALHTAGHLINAAGNRLGYKYAGCIHYPGQARVEFFSDKAPTDVKSLHERIEHDVLVYIAGSAAVHGVVSEGGLRTITIDGICEDLCAGTHVAHLGLIRDFCIRAIKIKGDRIRVGYSSSHADSEP
jgi:alanyl-tRNA synthetase